MKKIGLIVAALAILIGIVWILQGAGWLGGSFMTGDPKWFWIGIVVALAGCGGVIRLTRRRG